MERAQEWSYAPLPGLRATAAGQLLGDGAPLVQFIQALNQTLVRHQDLLVSGQCRRDAVSELGNKNKHSSTSMGVERQLTRYPASNYTD